MDKQELFNKAYLGLAGQKFTRSAASVEVHGGLCLYRGTDGLKCAIGHAIPDELYDPEMDPIQEGATAVPLQKILDLIGYIGPDNFAQELQSAHDGAVTALDMRDRLKALARNHNLTVPLTYSKGV
jgi:hypothetical protein